MVIVDAKLVVEEQVLNLAVVENVTYLTDDTESTVVLIDEETIYYLTEEKGGAQDGRPTQDMDEEEMAYSKRIDFVTENLIYKGEGTTGSLESAPAWRIRRIVIAGDGDISETWANGTANFSQIWDNRSLLTYS